MLHAVHTETACQHKDYDNKNRRDNLISFLIKYCSYDIEGIVLGVESEQVKNPCHTKHTENNKA